MSMGQKALVVISLTLAGLMTVLYATARFFLLRTYLRLEQQQTIGAVERAVMALTDELSGLAATANDYAAWDRTYQFMGHHTPDYLKTEYQDDTLNGLKVNSVLLLNDAGDIVFFKGYDFESNQEIAVPAETQSELALNNWVRQAYQDQVPRTGILMLSHGPALAAACPILTSRRSGPARGVLVMTRNLDQLRVARLSELTGSDLAIFPFEYGKLEPRLWQALKTDPRAMASLAIDDRHIGGYTVLEDVRGKPALLLRLIADRGVFRDGVATLHYFLAAFCVAGLIFGSTILLSLRVVGLNRLARLNAQVRGIAERKDLRERVAIKGNDELAQLGGVINAMLEALQKSDAQFRQIAENIHQVFWIKSASSGNFVFISHAYETIWGRPLERLYSNPNSWRDAIHPEDRSLVDGMLQQQNRGKIGSADFRVIRPDGSVRWICNRYFPVCDAGGRLVQIAGLAEDVTEFKRAETVLRRSQEELESLVQHRTAELAEANRALHQEVKERKQAQKALQASEEHFKQLFATIPLPVWLYEQASRRFLEVNSAATYHYGFSHDEFLQMTMDDIELEDETGWQVRPASSHSHVPVRKHRKKDGTMIDVELHRHSVKVGGADAVLLAAQDVTLRNQLEVELRHGQKMQAVGELAAGIAHEINTPIQFVGDNIRFMQDSFGDLLVLIDRYRQLADKAEDHSGGEALKAVREAEQYADMTFLRREIPAALAQSTDGIERVSTIVQALKKFAHLDQNPEKAAADLNDALQSTLTVARSEMKYVADVETRFGALPPVLCHLGDLNQVFLNLLVNAAHTVGDVMRTTGKKGHIEVTTRVSGKDAEVAISDSGTGIPAEIRHRIFEPFFTTKEVGKGSGQGLALAHAVVVQKHGGTLTFETEVGKGTTFYIRIPFVPPA